jgi:hypothetical protein
MKYKVIIDASISDSPKKHEFAVATILAAHFKSDIIFIRPASFRTPDFDIKGMKWELKSPMGSSARTIENNMRTARKQSKNIIIDLTRIKLHQRQAEARLNFFLSRPSQFKKVLVITKTKKVIEVR